MLILPFLSIASCAETRDGTITFWPVGIVGWSWLPRCSSSVHRKGCWAAMKSNCAGWAGFGDGAAAFVSLRLQRDRDMDRAPLRDFVTLEVPLVIRA